MLTEGDRTDAFVQNVSGAFKGHVLSLLLSRSIDDPAGVRAAVAAIREKLEALDVLIGGSPEAAGAPNGATHGSEPKGPSGDGAVDFEEIGRNQRSRLREILLLEALASEARAFPLGQLMRALEEKGFADSSPAVVSQLHRMKKLGVIDQPANGMYEITQEGLGHLRKLRSSFGALLRNDGRGEAR